jgi:hypothetical protein
MGGARRVDESIRSQGVAGPLDVVPTVRLQEGKIVAVFALVVFVSVKDPGAGVPHLSRLD